MKLNAFYSQIQFYFRLKKFQTSLLNLMKEEHLQSVQIDKLREYVNKEHSSETFDDDELFAAIEKMMEDNQLMLADQTVFLI